MQDRTPRPGDLEPIERAPSTSCARCSSSGCGGRCGTRTTTCRTTGAAFDAAGVHPDDLQGPRRPGPVPVHRPRRTCATTTRSACSPCRASRSSRIHASSGTTGKPTVVGYTARRHPAPGPRLMARSIRAAGGRPGDVVHVAYGYGLFTGGLGAHYGAEELGCTVVPVSGGMTERQVMLIRDFRARRHHGHAVATCWRSSTRWSARASTRARRRCRSASSAPSRGPRTCAARSSSAWTCTRSTSTGCPR